MKRLTTLSLIAIAAAAMVAIPVDAQTRGGSNSRSGSGGGNSRNGIDLAYMGRAVPYNRQWSCGVQITF